MPKKPTDYGERPRRRMPGLFAQVVGRRYRDPTVELEGLTDAPDGGMASGWVIGVLWAAVVAAFGAYCLIAGRAWMPNFRPYGAPPPHRLIVVVTGTEATAIGWLCVGYALWAHFHWFWGNHPRLGRYYELGRFAAIVVMFIAAAMLVYRVVTTS